MMRFAKVEVATGDEVTLPVRALRRRELEALLELRHFEDERVQLLDGALVAVPAASKRRTIVAERLAGMLRRQLGPAWTVLRHVYLALDEHSMPEAELIVMPLAQPIEPVGPARPVARVAGAPWPLVVELADLARDSDAVVKAMLYAEAAIPTCWIVDPARRVARLHERPVGGWYTEITTLGVGAVLTARALPAVALPVGEIVAGP